MRVFAALPLPPAAKSAIEEALATARSRFTRVKWVRADGMHLTLHFFGEVPNEGVAALSHVFEDAALRRPCIPARLGKPGQFPQKGSPRVLWIGLEKGVEEMRDYWRLFESKIAPLGWTADARGFSPHVTIARAGSAPVDPGWTECVELPALDFAIEECVLFQSILDRAGARYIPVQKIAFAKGIS
ncbi:MAG: RNA 2',3'-cyclic phosphodiesterase [Spirochaetia bacterium]|jgi:2'-5' RNA ligase